MWFKYQNTGDDAVAVFLRQLKVIPNRDVEIEGETTLRKRRTRKIKAVWRFWEIAIGMNELYIVANKTFIEDWWAADRCWIELSEDPENEPTVTWIEVSPPGGAVPFTYPTGNKYLPSFAATIYATEGT